MSIIGSGTVKSFQVKFTAGNRAQPWSLLAAVLRDPGRAAQTWLVLPNTAEQRPRGWRQLSGLANSASGYKGQGYTWLKRRMDSGGLGSLRRHW